VDRQSSRRALKKKKPTKRQKIVGRVWSTNPYFPYHHPPPLATFQTLCDCYWPQIDLLLLQIETHTPLCDFFFVSRFSQTPGVILILIIIIIMNFSKGCILCWLSCTMAVAFQPLPNLPRGSSPVVVVVVSSSSSSSSSESEVEAPSLSSSLGLTKELSRMTEAFRTIGDDQIRYKQLLYMAQNTPQVNGLPDSSKIPGNKVPGCLSTVYVDGTATLNSDMGEYVIDFVGDSDGLLTRGLVALLVR
jgi:hypothetical protein